jgi:hypothetical protein
MAAMFAQEIDEDAHELLWVTDFPMFEWNADEGRLEALHHPFTAPNPEDVEGGVTVEKLRTARAQVLPFTWLVCKVSTLILMAIMDAKEKPTNTVLFRDITLHPICRCSPSSWLMFWGCVALDYDSSSTELPSFVLHPRAQSNPQCMQQMILFHSIPQTKCRIFHTAISVTLMKRDRETHKF